MRARSCHPHLRPRVAAARVRLRRGEAEGSARYCHCWRCFGNWRYCNCWRCFGNWKPARVLALLNTIHACHTYAMRLRNPRRIAPRRRAMRRGMEQRTQHNLYREKRFELCWCYAQQATAKQTAQHSPVRFISPAVRFDSSGITGPRFQGCSVASRSTGHARVVRPNQACSTRARMFHTCTHAATNLGRSRSDVPCAVYTY